MNNFEHLSTLTFKELEALLDKVQQEYADALQRRWNLIAKILFYEAKLKEEQANGN